MSRPDSSSVSRSGHIDATIVDTEGPVGGPRSSRAGRLGIERGDTIGRYVVLGTVGSGAMGVVYAAYDPELDRKVALKVVKPRDTGLDTSTGRSRMVREAQALAKLNHPHVVTVHDVGTANDRVFIAMEFVEGQTLGDWMQAAVRPWSEVMRVMAQAGRGLAAAHKVGLVHRDFKPDNVMLRDDGHAVVMDFGLARADDDVVPVRKSGRALEDTKAKANADALATPLTQSGALMGTPAYMAPEQHLGLAVDGRSDQFSFCVSMYEALYGERPYQGDTVAALGVAITSGDIRETPPGRSVPSWLHKLVTRGLSPLPERRFESMDLVVEALERSRERARGRWLAGALVGAAVATTVAIVGGREDPSTAPPVCEGAASALDEVWGETRRAAIESAFTATKLPYATAAHASAARALDRYATRWAEMAEDNCRATMVRHEQPEVTMELRRTCLQQRLRALDNLAGVFAQADRTTVDRAVRATATLPGLSTCADLDALRSAVPPPEDPAVAAQVDRLSETLASAKALGTAGRYEQAAEVVSGVLASADELGYAPLMAESAAVAGAIERGRGRYDRAAELLTRAYDAAVVARHDTVAAQTASSLTYVVGYRLARYEAGRVWGTQALALALRLDPGGLLEAQAQHDLGVIDHASGQPEEALKHYRASLAIREKHLSENDPRLADSYNNLANVESEIVGTDIALEHYERTRKIRVALMGAEHPEIAGVYNNVGLTLREAGRVEEAIPNLEASVRITEGSVGEHPDLAQSLLNLASTLNIAGQTERAMRTAKRAQSIRNRFVSEDHPDRGDDWNVIAQIELARDAPEAALEAARAALKAYEAGFGADHPAVAEACATLGAVHLARQQPERAVEVLERAMAIEPGAPVRERGSRRFALARAVWQVGEDRDRALELARAAAGDFDAAGPGFQPRAREVRAWISAPQ